MDPYSSFERTRSRDTFSDRTRGFPAEDEDSLLSDKTRELLRLLDEEASPLVESDDFDLKPSFQRSPSRQSDRYKDLNAEESEEILERLDTLLRGIESSAGYARQEGRYERRDVYEHAVPRDYHQFPRSPQSDNRTGLALLGASIVMSLLFLTNVDRSKLDPNSQEAKPGDPNKEKVEKPVKPKAPQEKPTPPRETPKETAPLKITNGLHHGIRTGVLRDRSEITGIVIHDTDGTTSEGAISTLLQRGYGYHFLIERDHRGNEIIMLADPKYQVSHAKGGNKGTIGISMVGGYRGHPLTAKQVETAKRLVMELKKKYPDIKLILGHNDIKGAGGHSDPRGVNMAEFAKDVGLKHDKSRSRYLQDAEPHNEAEEL